ncbi:Chitin-binding, domain [Paramyrothecium foliicola]|nr:Chitin-binding, domain [Paramyrothecium foliicola]
MFAKTIALSGLAAMASAHILMTNPVPYGASSLNNSPLDASGSDFPCKQRPGVYELEGASNVYPQGSTQQLSFKGTAVHGGGSCQVSVTTDRQPDANSVWKVIKSIEGGCPARGAAGNIGNDPNTPVPDTYDFEIPSDLPAGEYSLAWTWFNKIGNREMYMNCAPITVTGSGGDVSTFNALPDMFVANINDCRVSEGNDVQFPNPGSFVAQENGATNVFAAPQGACATGSSGGSPPKDPEPVEPSQPTETPQPPQVTEAPAQPTGLPGNVFITVSSNPEPTKVTPPTEPTEPAEVTPPAEPTQVAPPTKPEEPVTEQPATPPAAPVTGGQSGPCSNEGAWNCIGGTSFQRCASGAWSAVQQMAAGLSCEEGVSESLNLAAKRFFPRRPSRIMA